MTTTRTAVLHHEGGMRFRTETGTGRAIRFGDHAEDEELSPVETVLAALAACSAMDVVSIALKKRQSFRRYDITVAGEQRDAYPQVFTRIDIVHEVEGDEVSTEAIRRCIELSAGKYCPVNAMLAAGATEIHHGYRIVRRSGIEAAEVMVTGPDRRPDIVD